MESPRDDATILVIDDSPTNLRLLLETLQAAGYRTLIAPSGERALRQMKLVRPDLILLDVMMPGIDGFETCRRIKESPDTRDIPVIFVTALAKSSEKLRGFEMGGVDYVTKPFQQEEVLSRVRTHLTLRRQQTALEAANQTKDRFFSIVAHDMRGAFNSLFAYADIMAEQVAQTGPESLRQTSNKLSESVENAYRLLQNLLQWARIQRGQMEFQPRNLNISDLIKDILTLTGGHREKKRITAENAIPPDTCAWGDERMLHTVFRNLVTNAVKFTPMDGRIALRAQSDGDRLRIFLEDNGVGIDPEHLDRLFRIDVKHQETGTEGEPGTGLGLVLCNELIHQNGGEIAIASQPGEGTTVAVTLPKSEHPAADSLTAAAQS
ncbi:MAG: response regulator [Desulfococcaceae bacterium]